MEIRYRNFNNYFQKIFGERVVKLSLDAGFSCPNRDGATGKGGCIFCSESGSGDFSGRREESLELQASRQRTHLKTKWPTSKFIAYLQAFTNTYADVDTLRRIYERALSLDGVVGLAIATRADCLPPEVVDLLAEIEKKTFLWVELGLQCVDDKALSFLERGYDHRIFVEGQKTLRKRGIRTLAHVIIGVPGQEEEDLLKTVDYVNEAEFWGIKFHSLYIQEHTKLAQRYAQTPFPLWSRERYVSAVCDAIERLDPETVIHRLTGDCAVDELVAPLWSADKRKVLAGIGKELKTRGTFQGARYR
jgi:radical SAM protein (TIGR01212 family)